MAASTIAFTAAAGAMTLALTTTLMAWRTRLRLSKSNEELGHQLNVKSLALGELDAATGVFDEAYLAVEGDSVRLVWGEDLLKICAQSLGVKLQSNADAVDSYAPLVLSALGASSKPAALALKQLMNEGRSCRFEVFADKCGAKQGGAEKAKTLIVEGRSAGATAWIRMAIASEKTSLSTGPFAQLADHLPAPCWICDVNGHLVWANKAWLCAVEASNIDFALTHNLSLDRSTDALVTQTLERGVRHEGFRWMTVNGLRRAYQVIVEPLSEGHVCAYALDVTESEESREALKSHAKAHDETLDALQDAVAIFGPEKRLTFHNRAFEQLWDLDAAWLAERPTHGELLERLRQKRRLPETADFLTFKARELDFYNLTQAAPDDLWSLPNNRALRVVRQPHPLGGILILFSDKTDEFKLKAQFNSLIHVQRATLDQLNDAICVFGSDGRLRLRNASFDRFWKLAVGDVSESMDFSGLSEHCLAMVHDRSFWNELKARITDTDPLARAPQSGEVPTSDGRLAQWRTQPLPDGATLIVFNDITATRKLEQAIVARDRALNESVRLKRDFVANVSYELRTPLTTIVGYADLLQYMESGLDERSKNYLSSIQAAAKELARSIDDVLDMAQIDAGEMTVYMADVNLASIVDEAVSHHAEALSTHRLSFDYSGLDRSQQVRVDARRLSQLLDQLLGNAVRHATNDGTIWVKSRKDADTLILDLGYSGRGIPYHVQAHIFDRYIGRERGGPGLGLALVKALVELHDGWITLESEPNEGAVFSLHFPHQLEVAEPIITDADERPAMVLSEDQYGAPSQKGFKDNHDEFSVEITANADTNNQAEESVIIEPAQKPKPAAKPSTKSKAKAVDKTPNEKTPKTAA